MTEILLDEIETRKRNSGNKHKLQKNDSISSMNFKGVIDKSVAGAEYFLSLENSNNLDFTVINLQNTVSGNILNKVLFPRETIINILRLPGFTIISNKLVMIIGYGNIGSTLAKVLLSSHCSVYIVEKDPCRALKAAVNGLKTVSLNDYIDVMDIVICSTQAKGIMHADLLKKLKPNSILCNMSNNKKEIDTSWLVKNSKMVPHNPNVDKVFLDPDDENKFFYLITKGINAGVEAFNLPEICMSMNCVLMSLAIFELHMSKGCKYNRKVYELPKKLDTYAARIHLPHFHAHTNKNE
ncbi:MAG: S-adenosylhomocysteine hydrolase-like protein 1 [Paramarteilia canceri]